MKFQYLKFRYVNLVSFCLLFSLGLVAQTNDDGVNTTTGPNLKCGDLGTLTIDGRDIQISNLKITNEGPGLAGPSFIGYYLSTDEDITTDDIFLGEDFVGQLIPGANSTENFSTTLDEDIADGNYFIGIVVDYQEQVAERSGEDNACYYSNRVTVGENVLPNLQCGDLGTFTVNGNLIRIANLTITNTGSDVSKASFIGYYLSTDTEFTSGDIFLGDDYIRSLDPGESSTESFSKTLSGIPNGTYYLGIRVDYRNQVTEIDESDNQCFYNNPRITVLGENRPNLTSNDLGTLTVVNNLVTITDLDVTNDGDAEAGQSTLGFFLSRNRTISTSDVFLGEVVVNALAAGASTSINFSEELSDLPQGTYYLGVLLDFKNEVSETSGSDNKYYYTSPRIRISEDNQANLKCSDLGVLTVNGNDISIAGLQIINDGTASAAENTIAIYLSRNTGISNNDFLLGEETIPALPAGATHTLSFSATIGNGLPSGSYFVGVLIDAESEVPESDERDNSCHYASPKISLNMDTRPNLTCQDIGALETGEDTITLKNYTIVNNGLSVAGRSHIGFYLSRNTSISTNDLRLGEYDIPSLDPDEVFEIESVGFNTLGLEPGLYYFGVIVDYKKEVSEISGSDNTCFIDSPKVEVKEILIPNLIFQDKGRLSIDGATIRISALRVFNDGNIDAAGSNVGYYISVDDEITTEDFLIGRDYVDVLRPGARSTENLLVTPTNIPIGEYYVGAILDYQEAVEESNEIDNICLYDSPKYIVTEINYAGCGCGGSDFIEVCDDFSHYVPGPVADQSDCWNTISGDTGGPEDALVVLDTTNGNQYLQVTGTNDAVLQMGQGVETLKHELNFVINVRPGGGANFDILHGYFPGGVTNVASSVSLGGTGVGSLRAGGSTTIFTYPVDEWIRVRQVFDGISGNTRLFIDGLMVGEWPFRYTAGSIFGGAEKLEGINFYPSNTSSEFWIDEVIFGRTVSNKSTDLWDNKIALSSSRLNTTDLEVYPNPSNTGLFNISLEQENLAGEAVLEIVNLNNQLIQQTKLYVDQQFKTTVDLSGNAQGLYIARLKLNDQIFTKKLLLLE